MAAADVLQARQPRLRRRGPAAAGEPEKGVLRGRRSRSWTTAPSPAPTPGPEAPTGCAPSATGSPCPTCATRTTAKLIAREVSDGVIAPGYTDGSAGHSENQAQGQLQRGGQIDPDYVPAEQEHEAGLRHHLRAGPQQLQDRRDLLQNIVTENKDLPESAKMRPDRGAYHPEVHPVQLRLLRLGRTGHRRGRGSAVPHPLHPAGRRQGRHLVSCASIPRSWTCPSSADLGRPKRDNAIDVLHHRATRRTSAPTASGRTTSPAGPSR